MDISDVVAIEPGDRTAIVPPATDYHAASVPWTEAEYHCYGTVARSVRVGYWTGDLGQVSLDPWPYTEVCSILVGRVAVVDRSGGRREFGAGEAFVVPKGFSGDWVTLEPSAKVFVAIE